MVIPQRLLALQGEGAAVMLGNTQGTSAGMFWAHAGDLRGEALVGEYQQRQHGSAVWPPGAHSGCGTAKKHVARIQGMTIEYGYGDEMTTWDEDVFQMLKSRLSCPHSHFDGTCNPESPSHWFKKFLDSDADIYCQAYTIDDNPTLPAQFVADLKKEYTGTVYYNRFITRAVDGSQRRYLPPVGRQPRRRGWARFFWPRETAAPVADP